MIECRMQTRQEGTVLVVALLFAIAVLGLVSGILGSGLAVKNGVRYLSARQGAQHAAESGVHLCVGRLSGRGGSAFLDSGTAEGVLQGDGERAPRYWLTMARAGEDGTDNDLDGLVDEPDEADMVEVESAGSYDGVTRTVRVTLVARYRTPSINSAAYLDNPNAAFRLSGNAFRISGNDVDRANRPTGTTVAGIGVNGPTNLIVGQVGERQRDNIVGLGGEPSIHTVQELDLTDLVHEGSRAASVLLEGSGTQEPAAEGDWGTLDSPAILYGAGAVTIANGSAGAGIMIINGDLNIAGGFEWHGLIVVRGNLTFKGGGGTRRVTGALVIQDDVFQGLGDGAGNESVNIAGTVDIAFSEDTLNHITQAFRNYTILNWREGPARDGLEQP